MEALWLCGRGAGVDDDGTEQDVTRGGELATGRMRPRQLPFPGMMEHGTGSAALHWARSLARHSEGALGSRMSQSRASAFVKGGGGRSTCEGTGQKRRSALITEVRVFHVSRGSSVWLDW